jgi:hypothetical protein
MTRGSIREYTEAVRGRYHRASKKEKGRILDEFTNVIGCHRKSAIRLLKAKRRSDLRRRRGRSKEYGADVVGVLRMAWEATDRLCSKRLQPFLPELVPVLRKYDDTFISTQVAAQLRRMSPSTIDRVLRPWRKLGGRRPLSCTKPGSLLKNSIPIRTFADWEENRSGFLEVDLVHHCGESTEGLYLTTLSTVDVASGWSAVGGWRYGERDRIGLAVLFTKYGNVSLFPFWGWTRTTAGSSSTTVSIPTAKEKISPSPGLALTRKTIVAM